METLTGHMTQLSLTKNCETIINIIDARQNPAGAPPAGDGRSFRSEISTLRKFSELLDKVHRAQPPRAQFEDCLWDHATVLISRCRKTLCGVEHYLREQQQEVGTQDSLKSVSNACHDGLVSYPQRTHVNLETKTLQLTLLVFNL